MSALASGPGSRRSVQARLVLRLALEGVPLLAICRAVEESYEVVHGLVREALHQGTVADMPARDWTPIAGPKTERRRTARPLALADLDRHTVAALLAIAYRLTPGESRILAELARTGGATRDRLHRALYNGGEPPTDLKIVDVLICRLRPKIGLHQIALRNRWGVGYYLEAADRDRLEAEILGRVESGAGFLIDDTEARP